MNIIADIYNKVLNFFQTEKDENSKDIASNRLKLVLLHDRTKLDNHTIECMRQELIDVISKYIEIDKEALDLNLAGEGSSIALMLNIPVVRPKTPEEIEAARIEAQESALENARKLLQEAGELPQDEQTENAEGREVEADEIVEEVETDKAEAQDEPDAKPENPDKVLEEIAIEVHEEPKAVEEAQLKLDAQAETQETKPQKSKKPKIEE